MVSKILKELGQGISYDSNAINAADEDLSIPEQLRLIKSRMQLVSGSLPNLNWSKNNTKYQENPSHILMI